MGAVLGSRPLIGWLCGQMQPCVMENRKWIWLDSSGSLCLSFLLCKVDIITEYTPQGSCGLNE